MSGRRTPPPPGPAPVAGVDGCRGGWLVVEADVGRWRVRSVAVTPALDGLLDRLDRGLLSLVAVDMPIGLPTDGPRACDVAARALLGPRRSSVFPAPARAVLGASDYADALARSRRATGRGLSQQAWRLVPRIAELDELLGDPDRRRLVVEAHPELAFTVLGGGPPHHPKRTTAGRRERLALLRPWAGPRITAPAAVPRGAAADDVLDALVLAVRAAQWSSGGPPPVEVGDGSADELGRPLRIRG